MKLTRAGNRTLKKFRRSPYASFIEDLLTAELEEKRHEYENSLAEEGKRGYILGLRAIQETLFTDKPDIED